MWLLYLKGEISGMILCLAFTHCSSSVIAAADNLLLILTSLVILHTLLLFLKIFYFLLCQKSRDAIFLAHSFSSLSGRQFSTKVHVLLPQQSFELHHIMFKNSFFAFLLFLVSDF